MKLHTFQLSRSRFIGLIVLVLFFGAGAVLVTASHAATPFLSTESESGMVAAPAATLADTTASGGSAVQFKVASTPGTTLTAADLQLINTKRIVFGHQSVGQNIFSGIRNNYSSLGVTQPKIGDSRTAPASGAYFNEFYVGENYNPSGKIADFNTVVRNGYASRVDVAFFKLCFVDILDGRNVTALFNEYRTTMTALEASYPNVKFLHVTDPLTENDPYNNFPKEQYNALMRSTYGSTGRLFDLAKIESTRPDGTRVTTTRNGQTVYELYSGYSSDGGHLNTTGSNLIAKELLLFIANQLK